MSLIFSLIMWSSDSMLWSWACNRRVVTLITWEKNINVLLGMKFYRGISLTPMISWHSIKPYIFWTILAPAYWYSLSENILFLDDWTTNPISSWVASIYLICAGAKGVLLSQTLLSSFLIPTRNLMSINTNQLYGYLFSIHFKHDANPWNQAHFCLFLPSNCIFIF